MARVTHLVHHADPTIDRSQKKETTIKHLAAPKMITCFQVTGLAIELSRSPDGTVNVENFTKNVQLAFDTLSNLQSKLDALQTNHSPEA